MSRDGASHQKLIYSKYVTLGEAIWLNRNVMYSLLTLSVNARLNDDNVILWMLSDEFEGRFGVYESGGRENKRKKRDTDEI